MKRKIILIVISVLFTQILVAQAMLSSKTTIKTPEGTRLELEQAFTKLKTKKYKLEAVKDKTDEYILVPRQKEDDEFLEGKYKPFQGKGDFFDKYFGKMVPAFQFKTIDGKSINSADLKGKILVLNFWFTGCKPCIEEMPALNALVTRYKDNSNVIFAAIALNSKEEIKSFLENREFTFQHVAEGEKKGINETFEVTSYPSHVVIDQAGKVQFAFEGGQIDVADNNIIAQAIRGVIDELIKKISNK